MPWRPWAWGSWGVPRGHVPRWLPVAYHASAALAFLTKGPVGLVFVGGGSLLFALVERRWRVWRFLLDPLGLLVSGFVVIGWPLYAYMNDPYFVESWRRHNVARFAGNLGGRTDPFYFYLYIAPLILLPWTPFVVSGLVAAWRRQRPVVSSWRLPLCWTVAGLAFLSLSAWKHKHYIIPILPPMSILAAYGLARYIDRAKARGGVAARVAAGLLVVGGIAAVAVGLTTDARLAARIGPIVATAGLGLGVANALRRAARPDRALVALFATVWLVAVLVQSLVMPRFDRYRQQTEFALRSNGLMPETATVHLLEVPDPQVMFYLRYPLERYPTLPGFDAHLARNGESPVYVVTTGRRLEHLEQIGEVEILDQCPILHHLTLARLRPDARKVAAALQASPAGTIRR